MNDNISKAFDFASDLTKQLITLATALLAFTVTFVKDKGDPGDAWQNAILIASWAFLILSIALGLLTLMALTGNLDPMPPSKPAGGPAPPPILTITSKNVTGTSLWQVITFFIAIVLTSVSGVHMLFHHSPSELQKIKLVHKVISDKNRTIKMDTIIMPAIKADK